MTVADNAVIFTHIANGKGTVPNTTVPYCVMAT